MLEKLKEYKELIAIVVFFLGGFVWLQTHFPSRDELSAVRCLLENYMRLTQLQIRSQDQERQLSELATKLSGVPRENISGSGLPISPAMRVGIEELRADFAAKKKQLGQTTEEMAKIRDELARAICGR